MRTELVCNGTADLITGNLTNHIKTSKREKNVTKTGFPDRVTV